MYTATDFAFNQMGKIVRLPCGMLNIFAHYYVLYHIWTHIYGRIDACVVTKNQCSDACHVICITNLRNAQNWDSKSERTNTHMQLWWFGHWTGGEQPFPSIFGSFSLCFSSQKDFFWANIFQPGIFCWTFSLIRVSHPKIARIPKSLEWVEEPVSHPIFPSFIEQ